ncbi:MAG: hypothetical protein KF901_16085 [Myxococcales bacterium]|nr:hypothetical protein [Myxococcales bacterium]
MLEHDRRGRPTLHTDLLDELVECSCDVDDPSVFAWTSRLDAWRETHRSRAISTLDPHACALAKCFPLEIRASLYTALRLDGSGQVELAARERPALLTLLLHTAPLDPDDPSDQLAQPPWSILRAGELSGRVLEDAGARIKHTQLPRWVAFVAEALASRTQVVSG